MREERKLAFYRSQRFAFRGTIGIDALFISLAHIQRLALNHNHLNRAPTLAPLLRYFKHLSPQTRALTLEHVNLSGLLDQSEHKLMLDIFKQRHEDPSIVGLNGVSILSIDASPLQTGLQTLFEALPAVERLHIANNGLFRPRKIQDVRSALSVLKLGTSYLDISHNGFFSIKPSDWPTILTGIPAFVSALKLLDKVEPASHVERINNRIGLPPSIITFDCSDRGIAEENLDYFTSAFTCLSNTLFELDLSDNHLYRLSQGAVDRLWAAVPSNVERLILKGNGLAALPEERLAAFFKRLPRHIQFIELGNNGFNKLSFTELNQKLRRLPTIKLGFAKDGLYFRQDNRIVPYPTEANAETVYRPFTYVKHTGDFSEFEADVQAHLMEQRLPMTLMQQQLRFVKAETPLEMPAQQKAWMLSLLSPTPISAITPEQRQASFNAVEIRAQTLVWGEKCFDVSYTNLAIHTKDDLLSILQASRDEVNTLKLHGNALAKKEESIEKFIYCLYKVRKYKHLDLANNGFDELDHTALVSFINHLPPWIETISFEVAKPVRPQDYLQQLRFPDSYRQMYRASASLLGMARFMLDDYTKGNSAFWRVLTLHWNRHYVAEVAAVVEAIEREQLTSVDDVVTEVNKIRVTEPSGSLARRLCFISRMSDPHYQARLLTQVGGEDALPNIALTGI